MAALPARNLPIEIDLDFVISKLAEILRYFFAYGVKIDA